MFKFLDNLVTLIFSSIWALFLIGVGAIVLFIVGTIIWTSLDLSNTWCYFALIFLGIVIFIVIKNRMDKKDEAILTKIEEQRRRRRLGYKNEIEKNKI